MDLSAFRKSLVIAGALVALATSAQAGPLEYSFTGTFGRGTLNLGAGEIDLTDVAFTVTGVTGNQVVDRLGFSPWVWEATSTYDFGALGSTTVSDYYWQFGSSTQIVGVGLKNYYLGIIDDQGFSIEFPPVVGDRFVLTALGTVTPTLTMGGIHRNFYNDAGEHLEMWDEPVKNHNIQITSATVNEVPEPASLLLVALGGSLLAARRRAAQHTS